jgi:putative sigma-54 modulation protein
VGKDGLQSGAGRDAASRPSFAAPVAPALKVIKEQTFTVRQLRVDDAVMQMNLLESEFFVFLDVDTKAVSVVYRRKDGNYGLIETGARLEG